jgi:hypothetical protein
LRDGERFCFNVGCVLLLPVSLSVSNLSLLLLLAVSRQAKLPSPC